MVSLTAKRRLAIYVAIIGCGLAVVGWQAEEHVSFRRDAAQTMINRGRDITSTLGVVIRSQRRFGPVVWKERLQSALQDLVRPEELESIAILGATGETIASAGEPVQLTPEMLRARGAYWHDRSVTIMNVMDLGPNSADDGTRPAAIVVNDERTARAFRPSSSRRQPEPTPNPGTSANSTTPANAAPAAVTSARSPFSRPSWMTQEEFDAVIRKQGVHSLVLSLSTDEMHRAVNADLLLRSLVSLLAMGGAIASTLALRNISRNADLQIRLVKAGEMNTHLKEMNLAAAGLAHETRNPLNLIRGLAHMVMLQAKDVPSLREHATTILEETDRVTVQLNEFINYSKPREAHFAPVEIARLVADVTRTLLPDIEEKQIQIQHPTLPVLILADEPLLRQALFNVLLNAMQAVPTGGHIEVRLIQENPRDAVLEIADDGPGVPANDRATIFKPYVTMRPKGVGLGLAIVQQIAAAHHWEVTCEANSPVGACFRFRHLKVATAPA
jgi:signal transduction histidine kinase